MCTVEVMALRAENAFLRCRLMKFEADELLLDIEASLDEIEKSVMPKVEDSLQNLERCLASK